MGIAESSHSQHFVAGPSNVSHPAQSSTSPAYLEMSHFDPHHDIDKDTLIRHIAGTSAIFGPGGLIKNVVLDGDCAVFELQDLPSVVTVAFVQDVMSQLGFHAPSHPIRLMECERATGSTFRITAHVWIEGDDMRRRLIQAVSTDVNQVIKTRNLVVRLIPTRCKALEETIITTAHRRTVRVSWRRGMSLYVAGFQSRENASAWVRMYNDLHSTPPHPQSSSSSSGGGDDDDDLGGDYRKTEAEGPFSRNQSMAIEVDEALAHSPFHVDISDVPDSITDDDLAGLFYPAVPERPVVVLVGTSREWTENDVHRIVEAKVRSAVGDPTIEASYLIQPIDGGSGGRGGATKTTADQPGHAPNTRVDTAEKLACAEIRFHGEDYAPLARYQLDGDMLYLFDIDEDDDHPHMNVRQVYTALVKVRVYDVIDTVDGDALVGIIQSWQGPDAAIKTVRLDDLVRDMFCGGTGPGWFAGYEVSGVDREAVVAAKRALEHFFRDALAAKNGRDRVVAAAAAAAARSDEDGATAGATNTTEAVIGGSECPICFDMVIGGMPGQAIWLPCGHEYCTGCFTQKCRSNFQAPVLCGAAGGGGGGYCAEPVPLAILAAHLPADDLDRMLSASLREGVARTLRYCPTPGCEVAFRPAPSAEAAEAFTCPSCLIAWCTACRSTAHAGRSCEDQGHFAHLGEAAGELGLRPCPACGNALQKEGGCDRVVCGGCKVVVCWSHQVALADAQEERSHWAMRHRGRHE